MKKRFDDAIHPHPKPRSLDSQPVLTERELRATRGGEEMSIPEKKQKNPG
jgi:hypothetical protein